MARNRLQCLNTQFRKINNFIILGEEHRVISFVSRQRLRTNIAQHKTGQFGDSACGETHGHEIHM
ncbi:hypothetical protein EB235_07610 [Mesorhizobium loti R88b]|uniref:Uncharacterized protein n=2 Tax=Rhizobium loti TaxID=381 RepID=A0A6M7WQP4_RHILI|nr:hypothetical protein EB235_07610 [Mesorhizobium loti R88b]